MKSIAAILAAKLEELGLWPQEAAVVMQSCRDDQSLFVDMARRWDEPPGNYPPAMLAVLWVSVKTKAAEWLAANKPNHFARSLFGGDREEAA